MAKKGYCGLDVDFEYVPPELREDYAAFVCRMREALNTEGKPVVAALAPKTSAQQRGLLYEAHDYALLSKAANAVFLMTYEWGYVYGEPQAIAPLPQVCAVLDYALSVTAGAAVRLRLAAALRKRPHAGRDVLVASGRRAGAAGGGGDRV